MEVKRRAKEKLSITSKVLGWSATQATTISVALPILSIRENIFEVVAAKQN